jgi:hypothetical protein
MHDAKPKGKKRQYFVYRCMRYNAVSDINILKCPTGYHASSISIFQDRIFQYNSSTPSLETDCPFFHINSRNQLEFL